MPRVLVVGGYGAFGQKAAERLARAGDLELVIAGRSEAKAREASEALARGAAARISAAMLDATRPDQAALAAIAPDVIINASGPFQAQDYTLARAAIAVGAHYIDLADARAFVSGITGLDSEARACGVLVTSGASSVPALAAAIVDAHLPSFARLDSIEHGITPGNSFNPGVATTASILGGAGKPLWMLIDGDWHEMHGWLGLRRYRFPGLGSRWMSAVDVPDLVLFPQRYAGVRTVRFTAGLEVALFHLSTWALAGMARVGLLHRPERLARPLLWVKRRMSFLGSDTGGMFVRLTGVGHEGRPRTVAVHLVARNDHGPYIPAIASVVIARKLVRGEVAARGAMPCLGLMTLGEFEAEVADLAITIDTAES